MALPAENPRYSFADVLSWEGDERFELIDGEVYLMAPPLRVHQEISGELFAILHGFLKGKPCKVFSAPFAVRPFAGSGDAPGDEKTVLEPDITVVCDPSKLDRYGCKGAPDLVMEILSPSTRRLDLRVKYRLYQEAGVREYWIVDPDTKTVQVFTLDENGRYNAPDVYTSAASVPVGIWEELSIDLAWVFAE